MRRTVGWYQGRFRDIVGPPGPDCPTRRPSCKPEPRQPLDRRASPGPNRGRPAEPVDFLRGTLTVRLQPLSPLGAGLAAALGLGLTAAAVGAEKGRAAVTVE